MTRKAQKRIITSMPRIPRIVAVGYPYHITQRGNYQQSVFETDLDYAQYLKWLKTYCQKYSLKIWAYCLMNNHVHFIAVPMGEDSLARTFNTLHMKYAQYFNQKKGIKGHLWQGRFYSCILDEKHLYAAMCYVENNPLRARIVEKPYEYPWSSARGHVFRRNDPVLSDDCHLVKEIDDWLAYLLKQEDNKQEIKKLKQSTRVGYPCGDENFIRKLEGLFGKRLRAAPRGRPPK